MTRALLLGVALIGSGAACRVQTERPPAEVERQAPDFSLSSHDGSTVDLASLVAEGPAILVFYRGHW